MTFLGLISIVRVVYEAIYRPLKIYSSDVFVLHYNFIQYVIKHN